MAGMRWQSQIGGTLARLRRDNTACVVGVSMLLMLGGIGVVQRPAHGQAPTQVASAPASAAAGGSPIPGIVVTKNGKSVATTAENFDDGDGDELLEHWGDPRYAREEMVQMGGLLAFFAFAVGVSWRRHIGRERRRRVA